MNCQMGEAERVKEVRGQEEGRRRTEERQVETALCEPRNTAADAVLLRGDWEPMRKRSQDPDGSPAIEQLRTTEAWDDRTLVTWQAGESRRPIEPVHLDRDDRSL
jgi:hypothetical protein